MDKNTFNNIVAYLSKCIENTCFASNCYCVGGCVRDLLMNNEIKDIDLVVSLPEGGIHLAKFMEKNGYTKGSVITYPTYGTAMFRLAKYPDIELECVQTRKEQYKDKNSRNPETEYGTLYEDLMRRDFTCNTLLYDITNCQVLDLTGKGIEDIKNKIIRSPLE